MATTITLSAMLKLDQTAGAQTSIDGNDITDGEGDTAVDDFTANIDAVPFI